MKLFITISIISFLIFTFCNDDITTPSKIYGIEIIEPENNFIIGEMKQRVIKFQIENETEVDKIIVYRYYPSESDTFFKEISNAPFLDTLIAGDVTCEDSIEMKLFARAIYNDKKEVFSNTVSGIKSKEIPPNDLLIAFNYKGYDIDSNLVAEGILYLNYDSNRFCPIAGRKNIMAVNSDSAYEKGEGIITSYSGIGSNNEFLMNISLCTSQPFTYFLQITGIWNDTLLTGERFTYEIGDPHGKIDLGSYIAIKR